MPRLCANLSFLFTDLPFKSRFAAAAQAGFRGVEFLFPYDEDPEELRALALDNGLEIVLFNIWPGDWDDGWRGLAGVPGREAEFRERFDQALGYARTMGVKRLHAMAGLVAHGAEERTYVSNLVDAARKSAGDAVSILVEPINGHDMPGYLVTRTAQAAEIIAATGADNVRLQLDLYHRHMEEGDVARAVAETAGIVGHYQIAGPPDRGEPAPSDFDVAGLFALIDAQGYDGWVGCEYRPRQDTLSGLLWRDRVAG